MKMKNLLCAYYFHIIGISYGTKNQVRPKAYLKNRLFIRFPWRQSSPL